MYLNSVFCYCQLKFYCLSFSFIRLTVYMIGKQTMFARALFILLSVVTMIDCRAPVIEETTDVGELSISTVVVIGCVSLLVLILILALCGGCTPMEVGSDQHQASGGRRSYQESSNYTTGDNNVNTRVLTSGTNIAQDPYQPSDNSALPYPVRPQTDNSFAGYSTQQPVYQQQQTGYQQQQSGYQPHPGYQQQQSIPGANRHLMGDSEPPPPSYNEVLGASSNQANPSAPYGW